MAANAGSQKALAVLNRILKPWQYHGVASLPEFYEYLPSAHDYRRFAPGSQPRQAIIPSDVPQHIYDIKYFVRDYRRNNKYTARTVSKKDPFDFNKLFANAPLKPEDVKYTAAPLTVNSRGY